MFWGLRAFGELAQWVMIWPEEMSCEWLRGHALPHTIQNLVEVGTNVFFVVLLGSGSIGSHALWISLVAFCVGVSVEAVLVSYVLKKEDFQGPPSS